MVTGIFNCSNIVSDVKSFPLIALFCFHIAWKHHLCLRAAPEEETVPLLNLNDSFGEVMETTVWSRINTCQRLKKKKKNRAKIVLTLKIRFANYVNTADCMLKVPVFARINLDMLISKHTDFKLLSVRPWMKADTVWYMVYFYVFCLFWRNQLRFRSNNETVSVRRADEGTNFNFSASYFQTANKEAITWSVVNRRCSSSKWSLTTCFNQDEKMKEGNRVLHVKWKHSTRTHREVTTQELRHFHPAYVFSLAHPSLKCANVQKGQSVFVWPTGRSAPRHSFPAFTPRRSCCSRTTADAWRRNSEGADGLMGGRGRVGDRLSEGRVCSPATIRTQHIETNVELKQPWIAKISSLKYC